MKPKILALTTATLLFLVQPNSQASCLPDLVSVLNENGQYQQVSPALLEQNSMFKGLLVAGQTAGTVEFEDSDTDSINPCYPD